MKRQEKRSTKATANSSICLWCLWPCPCLLLPFIRVSLSCLSQIGARNMYRLATRTSDLDIYSILLSVTDLCATYKFFSPFCAFQTPYIHFRSVQQRTLAIVVPLSEGKNQSPVDILCFATVRTL